MTWQKMKQYCVAAPRVVHRFAECARPNRMNGLSQLANAYQHPASPAKVSWNMEPCSVIQIGRVVDTGSRRPLRYGDVPVGAKSTQAHLGARRGRYPESGE